MTARLAAIALALILALTFAGIGCGSGSDGTAAPADFYTGKTINLISCSKVGGGTDLVARIIASYLERDTGANVVVTNRAGAGGLDGMNYLYGAEPDGLTLGVVTSVKFVANEVLDDPAATYDLEEFTYVMDVGRQLYHFMAAPDGPYQSVADLQAGEDLKIAGSSPSGSVSLGGLTVIELLDLDAKVITGISGEANRGLAVRRGEVLGYVITIDTAWASLESGLVTPLFVLSPERDPDAPEVPSITELVDLADDELALVELWGSALASSDMMAAPPGTPQDRLSFLHGLAQDWVRDEGFRAEIDSAGGIEKREYAIGEDVTESMLEVVAALEDFRALFAEMIEKYRA
jgi:tripartite-type tricarboxylate transporter receptor subunit TctC